MLNIKDDSHIQLKMEINKEVYTPYLLKTQQKYSKIHVL
jgi:hypothetical protein